MPYLSAASSNVPIFAGPKGGGGDGVARHAQIFEEAIQPGRDYAGEEPSDLGDRVPECVQGAFGDVDEEAGGGPYPAVLRQELELASST